MKKLWRIVSIFYLLFFTLNFKANAQNTGNQGQIKGKVVDDKNEPMSYITVILLKSDSSVVKGILSAGDGRFEFKDLAMGQYRIKATLLGSAQFVGPFTISENRSDLDVGQIVIKQVNVQLNEVKVKAFKSPVEFKSDKTVVNVENSPIATGNTAYDILTRSPGVSIDPNGSVGLRGKNGVIVMVDGKRSFLSGDQLTNMLKSTQGGMIRSIELITNPSAKYDAEGNAGIINIVLKKNENYGFNATVTGTGGYGRYYKSDLGTNFNYRAEKVNLFGDYNFSANKLFSNLDVSRENSAGGQSTFFDLTNRNIATNRKNNYKAGIDYFIDSKNTLGVVVEGYTNSDHPQAVNTTTIGSQFLKADSTIVANVTGHNKYSNISYDLNFKSSIDTLGQEFDAALVFTGYNNREQSTYNNRFYNSAGAVFKADSAFQIATPAKIRIWVAKADYVYPFGPKSKLETGLKSSFVNTDNNYQFNDLVANTWQNDVLRSNRFLYKENVNAAYVNFHQDLKSTTIQLGLRGEQTNSDANSITLSKVTKRHYFDLFPNVSINQTLSTISDLSFSASRRIDRPDYAALNPFIGFVDLYTFQEGNPYLNPQYTNSIELSYILKKSINFTVGYSHTSDVITQALLQDTTHKTLYLINQNLSDQSFYNFVFSAPLVVTKWWNMYNYFTVFYSSFSSSNLLGLPFHSKKTTAMFNTNQSFMINGTTSAEIIANYQSSQVYGTYIIKPLYGIDLGINKSFANNKFNVKLAANDVFNIRKTRVSSAITGQSYDLAQKMESQVFRLTFSWHFGNSKMNSPTERTKGSTDEEKRVKVGAN